LACRAETKYCLFSSHCDLVKAEDDDEEEEEEESTPKTTNGVDSKKRKVETPNSPQKQAKTDLHEIFVGNIPYTAKEETYKKLFEECGEVVKYCLEVRQSRQF
jgi:RNA recognition motif-containing protein